MDDLTRLALNVVLVAGYSGMFTLGWRARGMCDRRATLNAAKVTATRQTPTREQVASMVSDTKQRQYGA